MFKQKVKWLSVDWISLQVRDRSVIQTTDAERRTTAPVGLQAAVDELVSKYAPNGRSFVR